MSKNKNILIAEDEPNIRRLLQFALSKPGYIITEAADGPEAVAKALKIEPDLIVMDIMMPEINGLEVLKILRANKKTKYTKIMILSIFEEQTKAFELGANDYMTKPIDFKIFLQKVRNLLEDNEEDTYQCR